MIIAFTKQSLTLKAVVSNDTFSFCVSIHFLQKKWGDAVKISIEFHLSDRVLNSHDLTN